MVASKCAPSCGREQQPRRAAGKPDGLKADASKGVSRRKSVSNAREKVRAVGPAAAGQIRQPAAAVSKVPVYGRYGSLSRGATGGTLTAAQAVQNLSRKKVDSTVSRISGRKLGSSSKFASGAGGKAAAHPTSVAPPKWKLPEQSVASSGMKVAGSSATHASRAGVSKTSLLDPFLAVRPATTRCLKGVSAASKENVAPLTSSNDVPMSVAGAASNTNSSLATSNPLSLSRQSTAASTPCTATGGVVSASALAAAAAEGKGSDFTAMSDDSEGHGRANEEASANRRKLFGGSRAAVHDFIVLSCDRKILESRWSSISCLRHDTAAYGQDWLMHHRQREEEFQPWQFTVGPGRMDKLRLSVIGMYWESMRHYPISPATVFLAVRNFGRLLSTWAPCELEKPSATKWALTALAAYRLAFKVEERPEVLWEVSNFWNVFPQFRSWDVDRSEELFMKVEIEALRVLQDSMDMPLAPMFLALYLSAGGWPKEVAREYHELGLYLLALTTFAAAKDRLLHRVTPSKLAAAALMLAIKIVNGDRSSAHGVMKHLPSCKAATPNRGPKTLAAWLEEEGHVDLKERCSCRYEFFPERLTVYADLTVKDIQPAVKGLSALLRAREAESAVLRHFFPAWGDNDWQ